MDNKTLMVVAITLGAIWVGFRFEMTAPLLAKIFGVMPPITNQSKPTKV